MIPTICMLIVGVSTYPFTHERLASAFKKILTNMDNNEVGVSTINGFFLFPKY